MIGALSTRRTAARPAPSAAALAVLVLAAIAIVACGPTVSSSPRTGTPAPLPTPMASLSNQVAAARGVLQRHLVATGVSLDQSLIEYRPAEPALLQPVPRAVFRLSLADPGSGWVVVYDLGQADRAFAAGRELASYLGSGFGQTNFPPDARFHVNQLDGALVFAWWSPALTTDRDRAEAAFAVLPLVGQSIPVIR